MTFDGQLLPDHDRIPEAGTGGLAEESGQAVSTRDHGIIREWAARRHAEPATGEATSSGPAKVTVVDGGAGIRFNFPGAGPFRPIEWDEWLENFDRHACAFVYENDAADGKVSNRYRIVRATELKDRG